MALKEYFGADLAARLSALIKPYAPDFPTAAFVESVNEQVGTLELKGRVAVISAELKKALPTDYPQSVNILLRILGPENETEQGMFTEGYFLMPVAHFVEKYGLQDFNISMHALYEITKRHTAEYALRPYLANHLEECISLLNKWSYDENPHVRRLVSEGTRPRLPWAKRIPALKGDPTCNLALLEPLLNDPSFYVRKSVTNHINDLSKDYKEVTMSWLGERVDNGGDHISWIARHGLRSLAKSGDQEALALLEKL